VYPIDIYKEFINMTHFKQPELNLVGVGNSDPTNLGETDKCSHNIYYIKHAYIPDRFNKAGKSRSKSIALNVMGKPQKVLFKRNLISAVVSEHGATLLELINQKEPILLRDSVEEVNNLLGRR
tara:strand:- start:272 stop:640 length:369 start_codon:yes stop_codon:yes gene_type:complete